jgi:hypothetical protein
MNETYVLDENFNRNVCVVQKDEIMFMNEIYHECVLAN